ncbi:MAG: sensor histidine kinase [Oliverpabstia sp.]
MKKSIRFQIVSVFLAFVFISVLLMVLLNYGFLEKVYLKEKENTLKLAYREIILKYDSIEDDALTKFCSANNLSAVIYNMNSKEGSMVNSYSNLRSEDADRLRARLFGYMSGLEPEGDEILDKNEVFTILYNQDRMFQMEFVEMWGKTSDGIAFILRSPMESITESVKISNRFYIITALLIGAISVVFIGIFGIRITRPITELTELSQRMANLEFDAKFSGKEENEIGILGRNFNKMSETLEKTIAELKTANNELQKDIEEKEEIDEMRKEFLSNVSHELKTPIALIQGYAEGLQDNINDDPESREFYCDVIIDEASKMNQMVKKLLTLNQLEFGNDQVNMERFDLTTLVRGVIQSSAILAQQQGTEIIFRQDTPVYVWGDEFKVEEVVTNYLTNAIHYVKNENKIDIRFVQNGNAIKMIVFNTGDPIPEEDIEKVWIKFYKVDKARTREYGGSGIGLSIVKAIMDSMHQQCGVRNYTNGVAFWFTLESGGSSIEEDCNLL